MTDGLSTMFSIFGFNWSKLKDVVQNACTESSFEREHIQLKNIKPDLGAKECIHCWIEEESSKGFIIRRMPKNIVVLEVSYFANMADLKLMASFISSTKKIMPHSDIKTELLDDCKQSGTYRISLTDMQQSGCEKIGEFLLGDTMHATFLDGKSGNLDTKNKDLTLSIPGVMRPLVVCPAWMKENLQDKSAKEIGKDIVSTLDKLQHLDESILDPQSMKMVIKDKKEQQSVRVLDNSADYFVGQTPYLVLICGSKMYTVETNKFLEQFSGSKVIEVVDYVQFIIRKQTSEDWQQMCENISAVDVIDMETPTIHVLKWNPEHGLTVSQMQKMIRSTPKGGVVQVLFHATDTSDVKTDDMALFVRVGNGTTGLIGIGSLTTTEQNEDTNAELALNLLKVSDPAHPYYSMKELQQTMPTYDWDNTENVGSSLAPETATLFMMLLPGILKG